MHTYSACSTDNDSVHEMSLKRSCGGVVLLPTWLVGVVETACLGSRCVRRKGRQTPMATAA